MDEAFGAALLRLKEQLKVHSDKEVAEALGMKPTALNSRKTRGSFPEDKLLALIARRPELRLDAGYVMTGRHSASQVAARSFESQNPVSEERRGTYAPPIDVAQMSTCIQLVADEIAARGLHLEPRDINVIAAGVYGNLRPGVTDNARLVRSMVDLYVRRPGF